MQAKQGNEHWALVTGRFRDAPSPGPLRAMQAADMFENQPFADAGFGVCDLQDSGLKQPFAHVGVRASDLQDLVGGPGSTA